MTGREYNNKLLTYLDKMVWKDIPNYEGIYQVSNWGLVKSLEKSVWNGKTFFLQKERILIPGLINNERPFVCLYKNKISKNNLINRLVLLAFVGPCPEGMECCHGPDQNPLNNKIENLRWGTREENCFDRIVAGVSPRGKNNGNVKLTYKKVNKIREKYATKKYTQRQIGNEFNICQSHISSIIRYKVWNY